MKEVFGFVAEVTVSEDRNRDIPYRSSNFSEEMHDG